MSWGSVQRLVAPGGVGQREEGPAVGMVRGHVVVPSTDSGAIEILADWGALRMPLWMGKEVTLFLSDRLYMLHVGSIVALEGAVNVI